MKKCWRNVWCDVRKAPFPIINSLIPNEMVTCISCQVQLNTNWFCKLLCDSCGNQKWSFSETLNFSANKVLQGFFIYHKWSNYKITETLKGGKYLNLMHFNITSYWGWWGVGGMGGGVWKGVGGSSGFYLRILEKREKEEHVVSYQNKSCFFFLWLANCLSPFTLSSFSHHKHRGCAKKFMCLVQSKKAVTVITVMSSATPHLPSGSQSGNLACDYLLSWL